MARAWANLVGTCLGLGLIPVVPATWTSLAVALAVWALHFGAWPAQLLVIVVLVALGVPACTQLERAYGKDPKRATVDEAAGMMLALCGAPLTWPVVALAFVLFRVFDVWKLPPARQAEHLPEGWGIMADDVVAGIQARLVLAVILWARARLG